MTRAAISKLREVIPKPRAFTSGARDLLYPSIRGAGDPFDFISEQALRSA